MGRRDRSIGQIEGMACECAGIEGHRFAVFHGECPNELQLVGRDRCSRLMPDAAHLKHAFLLQPGRQRRFRAGSPEDSFLRSASRCDLYASIHQSSDTLGNSGASRELRSSGCTPKACCRKFVGRWARAQAALIRNRSAWVGRMPATLDQAFATVSTRASPLVNNSGLMPAPTPGTSGAVTWPSFGTGTWFTKYGNWCAYFQ